jgi:hypothetical protein
LDLAAGRFGGSAGDQVQIIFLDPVLGFCSYDLKVTIESRTDAVVNHVDLCQTNVVSFHE